jgi:hypothetical protein
MRISIIVPAHNEEKYIGKCLDSIYEAKKNYSKEIEIIVVANRCTDKTRDIALSKNAKVINEDSRNLSKIRNAGVRASKGDIIVTIDADSIMSCNTLSEIDNAISMGKYIGGGIKLKPERYSIGIFLTYSIMSILMSLSGLSAGLFWVTRKDFDLIGGFNEDLIMGEDLDFAKNLKSYGKKHRLKFGVLPNCYIITSCRKFDRFGDWHGIKMMFVDSKRLRDSLRNKNTELADEYFYDFNK